MSNYENLLPLPKPATNYQLNSLIVNNLSLSPTHINSGAVYSDTGYQGALNTPQTISLSSVAYNIVSVSSNGSSGNNNMTISANGVTAIQAGVYLINGSVTITNTAPCKVLLRTGLGGVLGFSENVSTIAAGSYQSIPISEIRTVSSGNEINLQMLTDTTGAAYSLLDWRLDVVRIA